MSSGKLSPSTNSTAPIGVSIGPITARSATTSSPFTGTSRNSEPSGNTTRTLSNGQTTCAFTTMYPPSISTPLPCRAAVSTIAIDGDTLSSICAGVSVPADGAAVDSCPAMAVESGTDVAVAAASWDREFRAAWVRITSGSAVSTSKTYPPGVSRSGPIDYRNVAPCFRSLVVGRKALLVNYAGVVRIEDHPPVSVQWPGISTDMPNTT